MIQKPFEILVDNRRSLFVGYLPPFIDLLYVSSLAFEMQQRNGLPLENSTLSSPIWPFRC